MLNSYNVVMYVQKLYRFYNIDTLLMMSQDEAENTLETVNHGRFINQFQLDIITSIWQLERINTKICRQKYVYIVQSKIYIYI